MSVYTTLPNTNLKYTDVRDTLNAGGGSIPNNKLSSLFDDSACINRFSKYKPVQYPTSVGITDALRKSVNWGYKIPSYVTLSAFAEAIRGNSTPSVWTNTNHNEPPLGYGWYYQPPLGGSTQPFRLGDYRGYKYQSPQTLFGDFSSDTAITQTSSRLRVILKTGTFLFSDFEELDGFYLAVALIGSTNSICAYTSMKSSSSSSTELIYDFSKDDIKNALGTYYGDYYVAAFMTQNYGQNFYSSGSNYMSKTTDVISLPITPIPLSYTQAGAELYFSCSVSITSVEEKKYSFNVTVTNNTEESHTINANSIRYILYCWNDDGDWLDTYDYRSTSHSGGTYAAGASFTFSNSGTYTAYQSLTKPWYFQVTVMCQNSLDGYSVACRVIGMYGDYSLDV